MKRCLATTALAVTTLRISAVAWWTHMANPYKVVCAGCERDLGGNRRATEISHGLCFRCLFKRLQEVRP